VGATDYHCSTVRSGVKPLAAARRPTADICLSAISTIHRLVWVTSSQLCALCTGAILQVLSGSACDGWSDPSGTHGDKGNGRATMQDYPSIFNDVIGPVMRGPSSSHCAAAVRIGRLARDLMDGDLQEVLVEFDLAGSLATTHESQGSDMGLCAGLLGWDATDERLIASTRAIREAGIEVKIRILDLGATHPNTYQLTLKNATETHHMTALSTGGGMIEIVELDGVRLSMRGNYYETLLYTEAGGERLAEAVAEQEEFDAVSCHQGKEAQFVEIKAQRHLAQELLAQIRVEYSVCRVKELSPVLPVLSRRGLCVPFITCAEMIAYNADKQLNLWELAVLYENIRGNLSEAAVLSRMQNLVRALQGSIQEGIRGTDFADRILGPQSGTFESTIEEGRLLDGGILNQMILSVTALMEVKSAMGVIVAAPTAGACGALPGACIGAANALGLSLDEAAKAMLAGGMIGVFIAARATFAAEVAGCQAECGAGSAMAAAALVTLANGTTAQAVSAASMALQNVLGLICDPVANRVEVPCLGRNVMAASNALACANMALAGFDAVIPLDEVIETMLRVGMSLPSALRCTALGGLSITETSKEIAKRLATHTPKGVEGLS
jgi:L-serine dehydratase